jgi:hypothetical protein
MSMSSTGGGGSGAPFDGGSPFSPTCAGTVVVDAGWLGGGTSPTAVSASRFSPYGARLLLATSASDGCGLEEHGVWHEQEAYLDSSPTVSVEITIAPDAGPGTYDVATSSQVSVWAGYASPNAYLGTAAQSGTLVLTTVSPTEGLAGSYHLDFGPASGGGSIAGAATGSGGTTGAILPNLGELVEDGTFVAPICELCLSAPTCFQDGGDCPDGQVCSGYQECVPAPTCDGAPSCGACDLQGRGCNGFDGFTEFYMIVF